MQFSPYIQDRTNTDVYIVYKVAALVFKLESSWNFRIKPIWHDHDELSLAIYLVVPPQYKVKCVQNNYARLYENAKQL